MRRKLVSWRNVNTEKMVSEFPTLTYCRISKKVYAKGVQSPPDDDSSSQCRPISLKV